MANEKIVNRENLKAFRQAYDKRLENGQVVPLLTKDIKAISKDSGSIQETPFISQGTATANNTAPVDTGDYGEHLEKQGNTVCVNQLVKELNSTDWNAYGITITYNNNVATFTASSQGGTLQSNSLYALNHNCLIVFQIKLTTATSNIYARLTGNEGGNIVVPSSTNWQTIYAIRTPTSTSRRLEIIDNRSSDWDAIQVKNVQLIDLTQWFNGDIPQDLLDNPEHWSWYQNYGDYIAYNTGELVSSAGRYLECGQGRNIYNPNKTYNGVIPNTKYHYYGGSSTTITYYDKNQNSLGTESVASGTQFTTPSNCWYINSSYTIDITISLYYSTGEGYDQYYAYEQPKIYDTGSEVLRSAGGVKDIKVPSGLITRNVKNSLLNNLSGWSYSSSNTYFSITLDDAKPYLSASGSKANYVIDKYTRVSYNVFFGGTTPDKVFCTYNKVLYLRDTSLNGSVSSINGEINYELATPTTKQGTSFDENIEISDYSYMSWEDTNNELVTIPQGCKLFYPAWYVGFVDSLGQRDDIDWNADNVASTAQLNSVAIRVPALPSNSADGTYTLKATISSGTITYTWVADE